MVIEHLHQTNISEQMSGEPRSKSLSYEDAISLVSHRASFKERVLLEGSPIYLYPDGQEGFESQAWDHPAFLQGWQFVNEVMEVLPREKVTPFVLVDEFNNVPENYSWRDLIHRFTQFTHSSPVIEQSPIVQSRRADESVIYRLESDYTRSDASFNVCSNLDAQFQKEKVIYQNEDQILTPDMVRDTLIVIAHPTEFKTQQLLMLASLLGDMKAEQFRRLSKVQRRGLVSEMFMHVWIDGIGNIESVTRPVWDGNKFAHQELV